MKIMIHLKFVSMGSLDARNLVPIYIYIYILLEKDLKIFAQKKGGIFFSFLSCKFDSNLGKISHLFLCVTIYLFLK